MLKVKASSKHSAVKRFWLCLMLGLTLLAPISGFADKKKKDDAPAEEVRGHRLFQYRVAKSSGHRPNRYQAFYAAQKISQVETGSQTKKEKWMDRLAGTQPVGENAKVLFQLGEPYGIAVDPKGNLYVADQKVGAIFIFNTETREVELIKNKEHAHFVRIIGPRHG